MTPKEKLLATWEMENKTTAKVLRAYPADKLDWKPHEKSRSAKELMQTFVTEGQAMLQICEGAVDWTSLTPPDLHTSEELVTAVEGMATQVADKIKATSEEDIEKMMDFAGNQTSRLDCLMMMLHDHIHHRGQFSVYLRMAGGLVPSIYGPTADEPMNA